MKNSQQKINHISNYYFCDHQLNLIVKFLILTFLSTWITTATIPAFQASIQKLSPIHFTTVNRSLYAILKIKAIRSNQFRTLCTRSFIRWITWWTLTLFLKTNIMKSMKLFVISLMLWSFWLILKFWWIIISIVLILLSCLIFTAIASFTKWEVQVIAIIAYPISFTLHCVLHVLNVVVLVWSLETIHILNSIDFKFVKYNNRQFI